MNLIIKLHNLSLLLTQYKYIAHLYFEHTEQLNFRLYQFVNPLSYLQVLDKYNIFRPQKDID